ncbi:glycosyltransferase family 4 protein [Candidatus Saccharibacteria bacterium]|nr:glycosyltransferase family 4 protein [Candidatus Saccharibacteria bacterium]
MAQVVIDARELRTSTGRYVERLLHYLQKIDNQNDYTVLLKPDDYKTWQPTSPKFKKVASPYREFTFAEQFGLLRQIWSLKPDLVHFSMTHQPVLYPKKTVTTVHDLTTARFHNPTKNWLVFKLKQWVYRGVVWVVAHKSKKIITPSEFVKKDLSSYTRLNLDKIVVTSEAADKITADPMPIKSLEGKQYLLYVGRAQRHKNLRRLVDAFQELKWTYPELSLVLAGKTDGNYQKLEKYFTNKKVSDVIFTDFVSEGELRWLYQNAQVYVFPSLSEGFGLPGLEAMLYGLPVASSNATCLPEIYQEAALYFDPNSSKDMAEKIQQLLDDKALAKEMSENGLKLAQQYSWKKMAQQTLGVYKEILNK